MFHQPAMYFSEDSRYAAAKVLFWSFSLIGVCLIAAGVGLFRKSRR